MKLDTIIAIIRNLKEEPTMSSGTGGFGSGSYGNSDTTKTVAGYDKPMDFRTRIGRRVKNQPIARIEAKK